MIADRADYEFARDVVAREGLAERCGAVHFSPVHGELAPRQLAEWILARSSARAPAAADAQVHLGSADPRRLTGDE